MEERSEEFEREVRVLEEDWRMLMSRAVMLKKLGRDTASITEKLRNAKVALNLCIFDEHAHVEEFEAASLLVGEAAGEINAAAESLPEEEKSRLLAQKGPSSGFRKSEFKDIPKTKDWIRVQSSEVKKESMVEIEKIGGITIEKQGDALLIKGEREALAKAKEIIRHGHL